MNTEQIIQSLANMPVHSPEWLENPSVRVELSHLVYEARRIRELQRPPIPDCHAEYHDFGPWATWSKPTKND